jgi:hypothetical protein
MSMRPAPRQHSFVPARALISSRFFLKGTNAQVTPYKNRQDCRASVSDAKAKTGKVVGRSPRRTPILLPEIVAARGGILLSGYKTKVVHFFLYGLFAANQTGGLI